jgi:hypothetical protein
VCPADGRLVHESGRRHGEEGEKGEDRASHRATVRGGVTSKIERP